jgi:hypothetical protein
MFLPTPGLRSAGLAALAALCTLPVNATPLTMSGSLTVQASGTSAAGNPVSFMATFTTSGSTLALTLVNTSLVPTTASADVLSSFYFDVLQDGVRPTTLTYAAAAGQVYEVRRNAPDSYVPGSLPGGATDLRALTKDAGTWQFRTMNPGFEPGLGFGIGTVGNSTLSPNNFDPKFVDQADYTIYSTGTRSDINPVGNLVDRLLVRGTASFQFNGLDPCRPVEIVDRFVFGLGTSPDSIIVTVPEPKGLAFVMPGLLAAVLARLIRRRPTAGACPRSGAPPAS